MKLTNTKFSTILLLGIAISGGFIMWKQVIPQPLRLVQNTNQVEIVDTTIGTKTWDSLSRPEWGFTIENPEHRLYYLGKDSYSGNWQLSSTHSSLPEEPIEITSMIYIGPNSGSYMPEFHKSSSTEQIIRRIKKIAPVDRLEAYKTSHGLTFIVYTTIPPTDGFDGGPEYYAVAADGIRVYKVDMFAGIPNVQSDLYYVLENIIPNPSS